MKKMMSFFMLIILLGLTSCASSSAELKLVVENEHFTCTPNDIISYLNKQNENSSYYVIPDFQASGEKIAVREEGQTTSIYLTFLTNEEDNVTDIELELYTFATEKSIASFMQYLTLLCNNITGNTDYISKIMASVTELTSSRDTGVSFAGYEIEGVRVLGQSSPGVYSIMLRTRSLASLAE